MEVKYGTSARISKPALAVALSPFSLVLPAAYARAPLGLFFFIFDRIHSHLDVNSDAIQPHDPKHMVNLLQVIEEVIPTVDFDKLSANNSLYEFSTLDAGQQLMIYIPQLLKTIDPDKEYEFCSISLNHRSIQDVPLDFNATVII